jgi:hypothetical protein
LNQTAISQAGGGVQPTDYDTASPARTAAILSWLILLSGLLTLAAAIYTVVINYSSLPFLDGWAQLEIVADGGNALSPAWLWHQHNEHRLIIPKLFLAADLELFQARQIFLLVSILAIQLLHWALLSWSMWALGGWRGALWRTGTGLAGFCLFCPSQWQNFIWGFQVCFVLPQLLATASFVALLLSWREFQTSERRRSARFLALSLIAALGATYSLASGGLLWPLLIVAALYLRLPVRVVLAFAVTGAISTALYLYHYVRPHQHADPLAAVSAPLTLVKYFALYFYSSWLHRGTGTGEIVALITLAVVIIACIPALSFHRIARPFAIQLVFIMLFCAGTAMITAAGRWNFGVEQARASRYQTVALLFWCCLGLLWLGAAFAVPRARYFIVGQLCLLLIFVRAALIVGYPLRDAGERAFAQRTVTAALISGVHDPEILSKSYPDLRMVGRTVPYMKANRVSIFASSLPAELDKPLSSVFPLATTSDCVGFVKGGMATGDPGAPGLLLAGWAWDTKRHEAPESIVITTNDTISGLGAVGGWVRDARTSYSGISSNYIGFYAFVPQPPAGAAVSVYAVLRGSTPSACYLDGWRQTANVSGDGAPATNSHR